MTARFPTRRTLIDRWIAKLRPMFSVIDTETIILNLGEARTFGPTYFARDCEFPEHIRRGTVWWIPGIGNCGFHVDFYASGVRIEAWTGRHRRVEATIGGEPGEATLRQDLIRILAAAGLAGADLHEKA